MKPYLLIATAIAILFSCTPKQQAENQNFRYLGEQPPNHIPIIFGADLVSVKGRFDLGFAISPDGKSMAFGVEDESNPEETCIYFMKYTDGSWTDPDKSILPDNVNTFFPKFGPAGDQFYFAKSQDGSDTDLWVAKYLDNKAVDPQPLDSIFNSKSREAGHGVSKSGSFYFTSNRDDQYQCCGDIYYTQLESSGYTQVQKSEVLSSPADEESLFLSPDDDYIIVQAWKFESESKHDLYISYRTKEESWTEPARLNDHINGKEIEQRPFVSPDNQFLFFNRMSVTQENEQEVYESDLYWVSTKEVFKPYAYNAKIEASVKLNEQFELKLPADVFKDVDDEQLTFQLTLEDDSAIPEGLEFDPDQLTLSGIRTNDEALKLKLTATDVSGNSGAFTFEVGVVEME